MVGIVAQALDRQPDGIADGGFGAGHADHRFLQELVHRGEVGGERRLHIGPCAEQDQADLVALAALDEIARHLLHHLQARIAAGHVLRRHRAGHVHRQQQAAPGGRHRPAASPSHCGRTAASNQQQPDQGEQQPAHARPAAVRTRQSASAPTPAANSRHEPAPRPAAAAAATAAPAARAAAATTASRARPGGSSARTRWCDRASARTSCRKPRAPTGRSATPCEGS